MENREGSNNNANNTASIGLTQQHGGPSLPPSHGYQMEPPPLPTGYFMKPPESESPKNNIINTGFGLAKHGEPILPPLPGYLMEPPNLLPPPPGHLMSPPGPERPNLFRMGQPTSFAAAAGVQLSENAAPPYNFTKPVENSSSALKKRRGRPPKYNLEGLLHANRALMPISSSVTSNFGYQQRGRGRGSASASESGNGGPNNDNWFRNPQMKRQMTELDPSPNADEGPIRRTHVLTVNAGQDVMWKIIKFALQSSRSICILSAVGPISSFNLRQSMRSDGPLAYQGQYEILSLTGSYTPSKNGVIQGRGGGMSVILARPDGSVFGGRLADFFIAAGPVEVVLWSFVAGQEGSQQPPQQIKKQRREGFGIPGTTQVANTPFNGSEEDPNGRFRLNMPFVNPIPSTPTPAIQPVPVPTPPVSFSHGPSTGTVYYPTNSMMGLLTSFFPRVDDGEEFGVGTDSDS